MSLICSKTFGSSSILAVLSRPTIEPNVLYAWAFYGGNGALGPRAIRATDGLSLYSLSLRPAVLKECVYLTFSTTPSNAILKIRLFAHPGFKFLLKPLNTYGKRMGAKCLGGFFSCRRGCQREGMGNKNSDGICKKSNREDSLLVVV
jgi:hypothetical protein